MKELYPHQKQAIERAMHQKHFGLFWQMGCLVGDTKVRVSQSGNSKVLTLKQLYNKKDSSKFLKMRSYKNNGCGLHDVFDVHFSGPKQCYKIVLKNKRTLTGTYKHKLLTQEGKWIELGRSLGKKIVVESPKAIKKKVSYLVLRCGPHHPYKQTINHMRKDRGGKKYIYYTIEKHRLVFEASINNLTLADYLKRLRNGKLKGLKFIDPKKYHIHHKDHNPRNNAIDNLECLTKDQHLRKHMSLGTYTNKSVSVSEVVKITKVGIRDTYDVSMFPPYHNYLANGIVVHNSGKTRGTVEIMRSVFSFHKRYMRTLILGPSSVLYNWKEEILKWSKMSEERIHVITGSGKVRAKRIQENIGENILILNWEAIINADVYKALIDFNPEFLVGDELHYVKNYKSKRSKAACALADETRKLNGNVIGLTGTPILNSPEDIYMQARFLDGGKLFGANFFHFRRKYMVDVNAGWKGPNSFEKWIPNVRTFKELHERLGALASRVTKEDCLRDLPPLIKISRSVELGSKQAKAYREMEKDFVTYLEGVDTPAVASLAITKALRLMEIISGFVRNEDGEAIVFDDIPRMKAVEDLLLEITPTDKVIIWACWRANYAMLEKLCQKLKLGYVKLVGNMSVEEKQEAMEKFRSDEDCKVVIASRKAAGTGINLVEAKYSIVYSYNFSLEEELQSEARNYRGGSQIHDQVIKVNLVAKDTIDERVKEALEGKQSISDHIIDWRF